MNPGWDHEAEKSGMFATEPKVGQEDVPPDGEGFAAGQELRPHGEVERPTAVD
jgi:hypothetical protein